MPNDSLTHMVDHLIARLATVAPDSAEYRAIVQQMDSLAAQIAQDTPREERDDAVDAMFDNLPV